MPPKPDSSQATVVPASIIAAANEAAKKVIAVDAKRRELLVVPMASTECTSTLP